MIPRALVFGLAGVAAAFLWSLLAPAGLAGPGGLLAAILAIALSIQAARRAGGGMIAFDRGLVQGASVTGVMSLAGAVQAWLTALSSEGAAGPDRLAEIGAGFAASLVSGLVISVVAALVMRRGRWRAGPL